MTDIKNALKNTVWAICILVCLVAVSVGLVIAAVNRSSASPFSTVVDLRGSGSDPNAVMSTESGAESTLLQLAQSADRGEEYINRLTFICDSSVIGLRDFGLLAGGRDTYQVWGTDTGSLKITELSNSTVIYPADGSFRSFGECAGYAAPEILVIMVGQDGLSGTDEALFKSNYQSLLTSVRASSPSSAIICCSISSVSANYTGADGLTPDIVKTANEWIKALSAENGVYFCDTAESVSDGSYVFGSYLSANGKTLNSAGLDEILVYLRTHALES